MSTAMRSAADIDDVGCPLPAALEERTESTRSCCPSSRHASCWEVMSGGLRKLSAGLSVSSHHRTPGPIRTLGDQAVPKGGKTKRAVPEDRPPSVSRPDRGLVAHHPEAVGAVHRASARG